MTRIGWERRIADFKQEVTQIRLRASNSSINFHEQQKQAECLKVQFLTHELEAKRKSLARNRGLDSFAHNKKNLPVALGIAAAASVFAGIVSGDKYTTAGAGISGFNGALQGLGETDWVVCLDRQLTVRPRNSITAGRVWFTWHSVRAALDELEQQAQNGTQLGNFEAVISEVRRSKRLVAVIMQEYKIIT
jgi:hypothetical protein